MNEKKEEKPGAPNPADPKPQNPKPENPTPVATPKEGANKMESDMRGYPTYPDTEDVFAKDKQEKRVDPGDVPNKRPIIDKEAAGGDKVYVEDETDEDMNASNKAKKEDTADSGPDENKFYTNINNGPKEPEEDKGI